MKPLQPIRTERLLLRPLQADDAEPIYRLFNNWEVMRWLSSPPWPYALDDARDFVGKRTKPSVNPAEIMYVICLADTLIGAIDCVPRLSQQINAGPVLGYWLGQPYWGCGYMTEAASAFVHRIFAMFAGDRIRSGAFADNLASLRVQEKVGFVRAGESMLFSKPRGAKFPHIDTVLTRDSFKSPSS